jgi:TonB-linked SusC/RagA family outer membrane protein
VLPVYNWDGYTREVALKTNTNWKDIVTQNAYYDQVSVSTGGGNDRTNFFSSLQYRNEYGLSLENRYQKATGRMNVEHKVTNRFKVGANLSMVYRFQNNSYAGLNDYYTNLLPVYPVYSPAREGKYFYDRNTSGNQGINPLYRSEETWADDQSIQNLTIGWAELEPLDGLKLRSEWGLRYTGSRSRNYQSREFHRPGDGIDPAQSGSIKYGRYQTYYWNSNNTLNYEKQINEHLVNVMAGVTMDSYFNDGNSLTEEGFPSDYFTLTNANTEVVSTRVSTSINEYRFLSYIARLKYGFRDRYFAEFQYRRDGSSRFGPESRWGNFPGGAVSWIASDESFMSHIKWLDHLKFRLSIGTVGNAEIGNYPYLSGLVGWAPFGNTPGFLFNNIGNQTIRWEKQLQTDAGFDFALFKGTVSGSFDYFIKNQNDLIVSNKIGNFHGYFNTNINVNLGDMQTKGFDFNITTKNLNNNGFQWTTDFNISHFKSIIDKLSPNQQWIESGRNIVVENQPLGAYYLALWAGVDPTTGHEMIYGVNQSQSQSKAATEDDLTGQILDANQMPASEYNNNRVILTDKTPYPDLYGGIGNTLSCKGLELYFLFTFQTGNYIYNEAYQTLSYPTTESNVSPDLMNGWKPENPTQIPLLWNSPMNGRNSSRFLYDGSYLRLKNVQLAYYLPKNISEKMYLSSMKFFVIAQNLATFTKYPGQDPEFFNASSGRDANLAPGIDKLENYPQMRTFTFGVNVSF